MGADEVEAQKVKFVEALGAKLAASFSPPEGGVAAPKHERARFTAVARAAIERLPTETTLRGKLLEDFGAISAALWEQYAKKHGRATTAALLSGGDRPPCILAAGGVDLALASGSTDGTSLEKLVRLPWLGESHQPKAAAALQTAIAEDVFGVSEALQLASVASCGEHGSPSPLAVAVLDATLNKLCASTKALPRHVAGARAIFHHLAQRPLLSDGAPSDAPATLRRACIGYLQMCSLHGGPAAAERRPDEPAARCAARHMGLMIGQGRPTSGDGTSSTPLEQLSALLYSLFTGSETRDAQAGSFNRIVMDTLVSLLPLEVPQRWRPTAPPDSYLQLLIVLRLAAQRPPALPAAAGKPAKGRKVARKLCEEVIKTLKPKLEVATIPRAVAVAARSENGGSDPGTELARWPVDRLRLLLARVEEHMGLGSDRAVASAERASASAEFFMDTGSRAENDIAEDDRDEDDQLDVGDENQEDQDEAEDDPAPRRPTRPRKPAVRGDGFVDPPSARKSPSNLGKRKVSQRIEELDLAAEKEEGNEVDERQPRKTRRAANSSSATGSAKKKSRTRSQRKQ